MSLEKTKVCIFISFSAVLRLKFGFLIVCTSLFSWEVYAISIFLVSMLKISYFSLKSRKIARTSRFSKQKRGKFEKIYLMWSRESFFQGILGFSLEFAAISSGASPTVALSSGKTAIFAGNPAGPCTPREKRWKIAQLSRKYLVSREFRAEKRL